MLRRDYIGHPSSDGTSMASRVHRYTGARWLGEAIAVVWAGIVLVNLAFARTRH